MRSRLVIFALLCLMTTGSLSLPTGAQTGKGSIESLIKVFATLRGHHWELDPAQLADAAKYIDYQSMAQRAIGEKDWQKLSNVQKKIYQQSFKALIERRYYTRWHRIFSQSKIIYGTETKKGDDILVSSSLTTSSSKKTVVWTLAGEPPKVINLTVGDKDLLKSVQTRFQTKITEDGLPTFLSWIQKKSKQAIDEDDSALTADKKEYK